MFVGIGAGALLGLSIAAPPGPMNALIATNTVTANRFAGSLTGLGAMTADAVFLAGMVAVGSVVPVAPGVRVVVFLLGAAVMAFLAVRTYGSLRRDVQVEARGPKSTAKAYASGLFLGLTNPFQILWWLTAGLAFMRQIGPPVVLGFFLGIGAWIVLFPVSLDLASRRWRGAYRAILVFSLVVLVAFAAYLVVLATTTALE